MTLLDQLWGGKVPEQLSKPRVVQGKADTLSKGQGFRPSSDGTFSTKRLTVEKRREILERYRCPHCKQNTATYAQIGAEYGVTYVRIMQIFHDDRI